MRYLKLVQPVRPTFFLVDSNSSDFEDLYLELKNNYQENSIVKIRGEKSQTNPDFFTEIGAVLQFPYYFGENWDALNDCLFDLGWLSGYVILVPTAHLLLSQSSERDFKLLVEMFDECNQKALLEDGEVTEGDNFGFHVVLQGTADELSALSQKLTNAGTEFEKMEIEPKE